MGQNIHSMLPKQNFDKSIMSSRCPSIFCPYFWPIAWRAPNRIGGSILRRMSPLFVFKVVSFSDCFLCTIYVLKYEYEFEYEYVFNSPPVA